MPQNPKPEAGPAKLDEYLASVQALATAGRNLLPVTESVLSRSRNLTRLVLARRLGESRRGQLVGVGTAFLVVLKGRGRARKENGHGT